MFKKMSIKEISDFVSQVGFPIVITLLLLYQQEKTTDAFIKIVDSLKELINDNTQAIQATINLNEKALNNYMTKDSDKNGKD